MNSALASATTHASALGLALVVASILLAPEQVFSASSNVMQCGPYTVAEDGSGQKSVLRNGVEIARYDGEYDPLQTDEGKRSLTRDFPAQDTKHFCEEGAATPNGAEILDQVKKFCGKEKSCRCQADSIEGLSISFDNGKLLRLRPELRFEIVKGQLLSVSDAEALYEQFKKALLFSEINSYCTNGTDDPKDTSTFAGGLRHAFVSELFLTQLENNGGLCNPEQKCQCEFSASDTETAPDFKSSFAVEVVGSRDYTYTSGSVAAPIPSPDGEPARINRLKGMVGRDASTKRKYVEIQLMKLEKFRPFCTNFDDVVKQGKVELLSLIKRLERH